MKKKKKVVRPVVIITALLLLVLTLTPFVVDGILSLYKSQIIPTPFGELVDQYSREYQVPPSVIYAIMKCESDFRPDAVSNAGACGLMQIMPDTFLWLTKLSKNDYTQDQIFEPRANLHLGVYYLSWLYERFGSWELVYAAYNAGHNRVKDWLIDPKYSENGQLKKIPIRETKNYVTKVSHYREQYEQYYPTHNQ